MKVTDAINALSGDGRLEAIGHEIMKAWGRGAGSGHADLEAGRRANELLDDAPVYSRRKLQRERDELLAALKAVIADYETELQSEYELPSGEIAQRIPRSIKAASALIARIEKP